MRTMASCQKPKKRLATGNKSLHSLIWYDMIYRENMQGSSQGMCFAEISSYGASHDLRATSANVLLIQKNYNFNLFTVSFT